MDLSRTAVERRDFPIASDGYEPAAVDAHLSALAAEIEGLQAGLGNGGESAEQLATYAGQHVQELLDAAQQTVTAITEQARQEAREISDAAQREAADVRRDLEATLAGIKSFRESLSALFELLRTQADVTQDMRRILETVDSALRELPPPGEGEPVDESEWPAGEPAALSRSGLLSEDESPEAMSPPVEGPPANPDELRLLAINLLLNDATVDEVRARLVQEYPEAEVDAAIEDAKRRI